MLEVFVMRQNTFALTIAFPICFCIQLRMRCEGCLISHISHHILCAVPAVRYIYLEVPCTHTLQETCKLIHTGTTCESQNIIKHDLMGKRTSLSIR
jgi:hypothetical protein